MLGNDANAHIPYVLNGFTDAAGGLDNALTGDVDWQRTMLQSAYANQFTKAEREASQEFNAYQAALDRDFQSSEAYKAYERSHHEAKLQRDFEERLSNTAYSRAVEDMKNAGINPYAMYGHGAAASTPQGVSGNAYAASGSKTSSSGYGRGSVSVFQEGKPPSSLAP